MQPRLQLYLTGAVTDPWVDCRVVKEGLFLLQLWFLFLKEFCLPYPTVDFQLGLHGAQLPASRTSSPRTSERLDPESPWPWAMEAVPAVLHSPLFSHHPLISQLWQIKRRFYLGSWLKCPASVSGRLHSCSLTLPFFVLAFSPTPMHSCFDGNYLISFVVKLSSYF